MLYLLFLFLCTQCILTQSKRQLPTGNIIIAYVDNCDDSGAQALAEARAGVNVLIWSFISNLDNNQVHFDLDSNCIAQVAKTLQEEHLPTTHLVSIGGWDAPHPNTTVAGEEWWTVRFLYLFILIFNIAVADNILTFYIFFFTLFCRSSSNGTAISFPNLL